MKKLMVISAMVIFGLTTACNDSAYEEVVDQNKIDTAKSSDGGQNEGDPHTGGPG